MKEESQELKLTKMLAKLLGEKIPATLTANPRKRPEGTNEISTRSCNFYSADKEMRSHTTEYRYDIAVNTGTTLLQPSKRTVCHAQCYALHFDFNDSTVYPRRRAVRKSMARAIESAWREVTGPSLCSGKSEKEGDHRFISYTVRLEKVQGRWRTRSEMKAEGEAPLVSLSFDVYLDFIKTR